ncbi:MAG: hypothetical protein ACJAUO_000489 [Sediminicola sp.]|jgi:hypothetical protein
MEVSGNNKESDLIYHRFKKQTPYKNRGSVFFILFFLQINRAKYF